jgi:hypothetical protein
VPGRPALRLTHASMLRASPLRTGIAGAESQKNFPSSHDSCTVFLLNRFSSPALANANCRALKVRKPSHSGPAAVTREHTPAPFVPLLVDWEAIIYRPQKGGGQADDSSTHQDCNIYWKAPIPAGGHASKQRSPGRSTTTLKSRLCVW